MGLAAAAVAQEPEKAVLPRVEIFTGSASLLKEGALPQVSMDAAAIRASGATSAADLAKIITSSQGATRESSSVGVDTFGFAGISIHNIGETRTLVLLNGRRLAQFGGQDLTGAGAGFDLNAIPLSAIEKVVLLTDGASSLYGADAIGGVVNFITKKDSQDGDISIGFSHPAKGGREQRFSATKGFGSVGNNDGNGYNVLLSFGHDERTPLKAQDRRFARTGQVRFSRQGQSYQTQQLSTNPIPANALDDQDQLISPFQMLNGSCPAKTTRVIVPYNDGSGLVDDYCALDFAGDLEIYPERKRDSFMASVTKGFGNFELFADVLLSRTSQVSRIAPVPGEISIPAGSPLHNQYLLPLGITVDSLAFYRFADLGRRTNKDTADFAHTVFGLRGESFGWDYKAAYSHSESRVKSAISGYPGTLAVQNLVDNGLLDPFVGPGQQSPAAQAAIAGANYQGYWNGGVAKLDSLTWEGSHDLAKMDGGKLVLSAGVNFNREQFASRPSLFAQGKLADPVLGTLCDGTPGNPCDQRFGDVADSLPYSASRTSAGLYGELVMPVSKTLELATALRLDRYSDFGTATTGKANFRWMPSESLLFRGSIGNGFHAPTVPQVKAAMQGQGVTSDSFLCTPELLAVATAQGAVCRPGLSQYDVVAGGNARLQPEKSKQASLGFQLRPTADTVLGVDLWHVQIANRFGQLTEQFVFANPGAFPNSWASRTDVGTGTTYLAFLANNQNLGKSYSTGIDLDFSGKMKTSIGELSSRLNLSYVVREVSQLEKGGRYFSAVGNFAELGTVTFRTQGRLTTSLTTGNWTNTLAVNFKSGFRDQQTTVDVLDAAGNVTGTEDLRLHVRSYATVDWQTEWNPSKQWSINAGILNLFNRNPPLSISNSGLDRGQQFGYDERYYDARGRTLYLNASYKF